MTVAIVLFTRDLRVHDNPVLDAAVRSADQVVPLFVLDPALGPAAGAGPARLGFLAECLHELDAALRTRGAGLVLRGGDTVEAVCAVADQVNAAAVHLARDASGAAVRRESRLRAALAERGRALHGHDEVHTVVGPGRVTPHGRDHFAVFTPYWRRWAQAERRDLVPAPDRIAVPGIGYGRLPDLPGRHGGPAGGERPGRERMRGWLADGLASYADRHDELAADATSRLSPYLHLGCISARELAEHAEPAAPGGAAFVRQLAWRDFHYQVLAARPDAADRDYRPRGDRWREDPDGLAAWREGQTGYPIVDAGMRQLRSEGWMHNRARLITASFLTKTLHQDWRLGAAHFRSWLLDADVANNCLNWQWVAGTGTDTRPNRVLNPLRQAQRFDPQGSYVRAHVPELADLPGEVIHRPWLLAPAQRRRLGYPPPVVDLDQARDAFRTARGAAGHP